jgi:hypothetical protein
MRHLAERVKGYDHAAQMDKHKTDEWLRPEGQPEQALGNVIYSNDRIKHISCTSENGNWFVLSIQRAI